MGSAKLMKGISLKETPKTPRVGQNAKDNNSSLSKFCTNCGAQFHKNSFRFCGECGHMRSTVFS